MTIKRSADHGFLPGMMPLCLAAAVSAHAQSFTLDNGVIRGVTGIEVQGSLYDVTFADGAFNGVYPAQLSGYGPLAQEVARALLVASESGALTANPGEHLSRCARRGVVHGSPRVQAAVISAFSLLVAPATLADPLAAFLPCHAETNARIPQRGPPRSPTSQPYS